MFSAWREGPVGDSEHEQDDADADSMQATPPEHDASPAAAVSTTDHHSALAPVQDGPPTSKTPCWEDALYRACLESQCLTRTPQQVLEAEQRVLRPRIDQVILMKNHMVAAQCIAQLQQPSSSSTPNTPPSWIRRVVSGVSWTASKLYQTVLAGEDDGYDGEEEWREQDDHLGEAVALVDWNEPVVCLPLVEECVNRLVPQIHACTNKKHLVALVRHGTDDHSFAGWCRRGHTTEAEGPTTTASTVLTNLNASDVDLIAHVLVEADHAVFYQDCILFGKGSTDSEREVAVALVKLEWAIASTEHKVEEWTVAADECTRRALLNKKNRTAALFELQKRRLLSTKIESARASLLNLEQAHQALEMAQLQQSQVLKPLEAAASALKALRQGHSVEDVDELYHDLNEEFEHLDLHNFTPELNLDEDELLKELSQLSISDENNEDEIAQIPVMDSTRASLSAAFAGEDEPKSSMINKMQVSHEDSAESDHAKIKGDDTQVLAPVL